MTTAAFSIALAACGHREPAQPAPPIGNVPGDGSGSAVAGSDPIAPTAGDLVILARVTDAGPIGDGACSQRSYQVAVDRVLAGTAPSSTTFWVHFELCTGAAAPPAGDLAGTGLDVGSTYQLTLRAGASANFAGDLMIMSARTP